MLDGFIFIYIDIQLYIFHGQFFTRYKLQDLFARSLLSSYKGVTSQAIYTTYTHKDLHTMAPSATTAAEGGSLPDKLIHQLQAALNQESLPLSQRYRALFGLKHHACLNPPTRNTIPAIEAIASAFATPSALLKHEVAYCLGQTRNAATLPSLRAVLENESEDPMVRHEAAEALGALGDESCVVLLEQKRDDAAQPVVVRETCEIAVERILWETSNSRKAEKLRKR